MAGMALGVLSDKTRTPLVLGSSLRETRRPGFIGHPTRTIQAMSFLSNR